jgi:hypothetical protein
VFLIVISLVCRAERSEKSESLGFDLSGQLVLCVYPAMVITVFFVGSLCL